MIVENNEFICSECGHTIMLEVGKDYQIGDIIECEVCGTEYEVVSMGDDGSIEVEICLLDK